jgi:hypothetical protein
MRTNCHAHARMERLWLYVAFTRACASTRFEPSMTLLYSTVASRVTIAHVTEYMPLRASKRFRGVKSAGWFVAA